VGIIWHHVSIVQISIESERYGLCLIPCGRPLNIVHNEDRQVYTSVSGKYRIGTISSYHTSITWILQEYRTDINQKWIKWDHSEALWWANADVLCMVSHILAWPLGSRRATLDGGARWLCASASVSGTVRPTSDGWSSGKRSERRLIPIGSSNTIGPII
jgi:hypothetical protein